MTVKRQLFNRKTKKMDEWYETFNAPEELEESKKRFFERVKKLQKSKD